MIGYGKQSLDGREILEVSKVLKSNFLTQGPKILEFENLLSKTFGSKYSTVVSNGTAALHLVGLSLGWNSKSYVITTPLTFLASANCILYSHATPFFVDIDKHTNCIDVNKIENSIKKLIKMNKSIKAIIGVDFAGLPCDWASIKQIASKYNITTINDNCHAIGASINNKISYAIKYADIVTHSYHSVKNITTAEGGAVLSKNINIDNKIKLLRNHGILRDEKKQKIYGRWYYEMIDIGYNYRLTDIQAAIGIVQIKKLNNFIDKRNKIAKFYDNFFSKYSEFSIPKKYSKLGHAYHLYVLKFDFKKHKKNKVEFFNFLYSKGINLQVHYIPLHYQPVYKKKYGYRKNDFPNAETYYDQTFSLPIYPELKKEQMIYVAKTILSYLTNYY